MSIFMYYIHGSPALIFRTLSLWLYEAFAWIIGTCISYLEKRAQLTENRQLL